ncbi:MAG: PEGA domain-containing protein [Candidatus Nomurabacteria bacterium]|jgi:hypothetical protein|nr:PEGA domain-containing protein [Candidatus Nomurabacteria bacterium]
MLPEEKNKRDKAKVILANIFMAVSVVAILGITFMLTMGYTITKDLDLAQTGLVRIGSDPSGATVVIDEGSDQLKTTAKANLLPGTHTVTVHKSGYTSWKKNITVRAGGVLWLDYIQLFPLQNTISDVLQVNSSDSYAFSPNAKRFIVLSGKELGAIDITDITGSTAKTKQASFASILTPFEEVGALQIASWSDDSSKVLVKHHFNNQFEWLLLDLERMEKSVNLTNSFQAFFDDVVFGAENGEVVFTLKNGALDKIEVYNSIIAHLDENVNVYASYNGRLAYITAEKSAEGEETATLWIYRTRDARPAKLREVTSQSKLAVSSYRSDDYLAVFDSHTLSIFSGQFQLDDSGSGLSLLKTIAFNYDVADLSSKHRFFMLRSGNDFLNYDIETENTKIFNLGEGEAKAVAWLNDYLFYTNAERLVVYDFDGDNEQDILAARAGSPAVISPDSKYLYFMGEDAEGGVWLRQLSLVVK